MKKTLLSLSLLTISFIGKAQCSDLFISEYVEGTNNNKALELYNSSSSPISLANYRILRHDNGNTSFTAVEGELQLPTNIIMPAKSTYVIALKLTDPGGSGQTLAIDIALQNAADTLLCPGCATGTGNSRVMCYNGDDALALQKNIAGTWTNIDIFGCRGEQPTNSSGTSSPTAGWTSLPPFASMPVGYNSTTLGAYFKQYWSQDKTLRRKANVKTGVSVNPAFNSFNPSVEWDSLAVNTYTGLGAHNCDCNTVGVKEIDKSISVNIYPNPAKNSIQIQSSSVIKKIVIYSLTGQYVKSINSNTNLSNSLLNVSDLTQGIYFMTLVDDKENKITKKIIIE
jgi:hypothetical protein